ncbi:MAG: hypothetical protein U9N49_03070 [Campylobacterota bacterium]|nr:hypothetical protein [Campylobacterota bacterium]
MFIPKLLTLECLSIGYTYRYDKHINIRLSGDWYYYDFGTLDVSSRSMGKIFDRATLEEQTYSLHNCIVV